MSNSHNHPQQNIQGSAKEGSSGDIEQRQDSQEQDLDNQKQYASGSLKVKGSHHSKNQPLKKENCLFAFKEKYSYGGILKIFCSLNVRSYLSSLPQEYLQVTISDKLRLSKVQGGTTTLVLESQLAWETVGELLRMMDVIKHKGKNKLGKVVEKVLEQGLNSKADLLVEDIIPADKCQLLGLPGSMIAASLAKTSVYNSTTKYDFASSLVHSLAINSAFLVGRMATMLKMKQIVVSSQIRNDKFLNLLETITAIYNPQANFIFAQYPNNN